MFFSFDFYIHFNSVQISFEFNDKIRHYSPQTITDFLPILFSIQNQFQTNEKKRKTLLWNVEEESRNQENEFERKGSKKNAIFGGKNNWFSSLLLFFFLYIDYLRNWVIGSCFSTLYKRIDFIHLFFNPRQNKHTKQNLNLQFSTINFNFHLSTIHKKEFKLFYKNISQQKFTNYKNSN